MAQAPHKHDEPVSHAPLKAPFEPPASKRIPLAPGMTMGVKGEPIEDGERDPDTIAEEQRRRSAEMEAMGVENYMRAHSTPVPEEDKFKKTVAGVIAPPPKQAEPEHHGRR